jgi:hypothetical protein
MRRAPLALSFVTLALALGACKEREKQASPAAPTATTTAATTAAPDAAPVPERPARRPLTDAEKADLARYREAMDRGRKATLARDHRGAIEAFDAALAARPADARAISERGYARLLAKDWALARDDLDRAARGTKDAKLLASIYFNQGLVSEGLGEGAAAKLYFARSNQLAPSKAAKDKLDGKPQCVATIDRTPARADVALDWFLAWDAMAKRFSRAGGTPPARPDSEDAVRKALCDGCSGDGPHVAVMGGEKAAQAGAYAAFVISRTPDRKLVIFAIDAGGPQGICGGTVERETSRGHVLRVHVRREELARTLVKKAGDAGEQPCDGSEPFDDCVNACVAASWTEEDWFLDLTKLARVLLVSDGGSTDEAGRKRASIVNESGGTVEITSGGCNEKFSLK